MNSPWPELPLESWQDTCDTLHLWTQIVGKTRLMLAPMVNHWWNVTLYVTPRGLTTSAMPYGDRTFAVAFDFTDHHLKIDTSDGDTRSIPLKPQSVADFYAAYVAALRELGIEVHIYSVPQEMETAIPFAEDRQHAAYDASAAHRAWQILVHVDRVLKRFRGRFLGKVSPVHFFWGGFDMAVTRFSGRRAPRYAGHVPNCPDYVMVEGYSHECCSAGFWFGGGAVTEPAFYSYAYPEPPGYNERSVGPPGAFYHTTLREFIMPYDVVRLAASPDDVLLAFLESTYDVAADLGHWNRAELDRPAAEWP